MWWHWLSLLLFGMTDLELWDLTLHNYYCQSSPFLSEELEDLGPCGAELWWVKNGSVPWPRHPRPLAFWCDLLGPLDPCLMWRKLLLLTSRQGYSSPCHTSTTLCITMFELYFVIILITFYISCIKSPCWILAQVINEIASNLNLTFTRSFFIHQFDSISIHLSILKLEAGVKILNLCSGWWPYRYL